MAEFNPEQPPQVFRKDAYSLRWYNELIKRIGTDSFTQEELLDGALDSRYYTETELDEGQLDSRYYTETELDAGQLDSRYYTESELDGGQLDSRYYTETESNAIFQPILGVQSVSTSTTATINTVYLCTGAITITLPTATAGAQIHIKKIDSGTATTISGTIDGVTSMVINLQYQSYMFVANGSQWYVV